MAGAGFKTFGVGDVLTASDVNTYLMQQAAMVFADSSARDTALGTATGGGNALSEGMVSYLADTDSVEVYDGSAWNAVSTPGVAQVVTAAKTDTFSTTSTSYTDVTGMSVTITPSSNTSKILVMFYGVLGSANNAASTFVRLVRDSTDVFLGDAAGNRERVTTAFAYSNNDGAFLRLGLPAGFTYLDSPATTSATTYKLQMRVTSSTGTLGSAGSDLDSSVNARYPSSLIVVEVTA